MGSRTISVHQRFGQQRNCENWLTVVWSSYECMKLGCHIFLQAVKLETVNNWIISETFSSSWKLSSPVQCSEKFQWNVSGNLLWFFSGNFPTQPPSMCVFVCLCVVCLSRCVVSVHVVYVCVCGLFGLSPFPKCILIMCLSKVHKYLFYAM